MAEAHEQGWLKALLARALTAAEQALVEAWEAAQAAHDPVRAWTEAQRRQAQAALVRQVRRTRQ